MLNLKKFELKEDDLSLVSGGASSPSTPVILTYDECGQTGLSVYIWTTEDQVNYKKVTSGTLQGFNMETKCAEAKDAAGNVYACDFCGGPYWFSKK